MTRAEHLGQFRSLQSSFLVLDHLVDRTNLPNQPVDVLKKRSQGGKPQNSTRITVSLSLFHKTFLTSTFSERRLPEGITLRPDNLRSRNVHDQRYTHERRTYQVLIDIHAIHHEKPTLEARKLQHDTTSSNDDFTSYSQSIKLKFSRSTTHSVDNKT